VAEDARQAIWSVNPGQPIGGVSPIKNHFAEQVAQPRFFTLLVLLFAGTALLLAAFGIYGVVSYSVGRRTAEIGVRMALGASRTDVVRTVVVRALSASVAGLGIGLLAAFWLSRLVSGLLYSVSPRDPGVFVAVGSLLTATAVVASLLPALRAARLDPYSALRIE
jgi:putative ABC transport system permease protein